MANALLIAAAPDLLRALEDASRKLREIVVTEGEDSGVILVSHEAPTEWDEQAQARIYLHDNFSPLGDALVALSLGIDAALAKAKGNTP